ncbi:hypothetical protein [Devosia sp. CN2-171]|uniref:hypothetical protein n=1 Tax=Devosia sp. CN2-171 TaxID=3400909 RepID=UPI003BF92432
MRDTYEAGFFQFAYSWRDRFSPDSEQFEVAVGHRQVAILDAAVVRVLAFNSIEDSAGRQGKISPGSAFEHVDPVRNELTDDRVGFRPGHSLRLKPAMAHHLDADPGLRTFGTEVSHLPTTAEKRVVVGGDDGSTIRRLAARNSPGDGPRFAASRTSTCPA